MQQLSPWSGVFPESFLCPPLCQALGTRKQTVHLHRFLLHGTSNTCARTSSCHPPTWASNIEASGSLSPESSEPLIKFIHTEVNYPRAAVVLGIPEIPASRACKSRVRIIGAIFFFLFCFFLSLRVSAPSLKSYQTWHKACFHCEVCKMMLSVNNFVSHQKKPYCHAHNPKNNTFTSVYRTPLNITLKKPVAATGGISGQDGEQFKSVFHWDMKSKEGAGTPSKQPLMSERDYWPGYGEGSTWCPGALPDPEIVRMVEAQSLGEQGYTEDYEQPQGKGSFPAMITPAYQRAKTANQLASQVQYKRGHDERVSTFTPVADTPELLRARAGGQLQNDVRYTEDCGAQRGKGSFPAMITPAYQIAKRANELASDVRYHQQYQREMKGKAGSVGAEGRVTKECADQYGQVYSEECDEPRGKGSFPAMITPAYRNAKKANELASDIKYRQDFHKMKGAAHFHSLTAQDNLVLNRAQSVNKLVSENKYKENYQTHLRGHYEGVGMDRRMLHALKVGSLASNISYKADYKHDIVNYNYPATLTPSYQTTMKLVPLKDVNYRQSIDKLKYSSVTDTPQIVQAKISSQQLSHVNYRADYERNKLNYTLPQDAPQLVKAKSNAKLFSEV
ncbi:nebulin-related-anchoring protein isoform X5, partial [Cricetulus griseus]|uniref:nebulin-related-anchoring protein isoform X5 n=1 Tax=Cricetulus griseus TaxID=10029 RepID=UPI0004545725